MGQIQLSGQMLAGPPSAGEQFPGSTFSVPLAFKDGSQKGFQVASGILTRNINTPAPAFAALQGVGPDDTVTQGNTLYFKCDNPVVLRLTTDDGSGGQATELVPVHGLLIREFPSLRPLELLEVQGNSKVEYFVSGAS